MRTTLLVLAILSSSLLIAQEDNSLFAELSMGSVSTSTTSGSDK
nr:hypothetical protein [Sulfurimonas sp. SAG-AH-194-C21]